MTNFFKVYSFRWQQQIVCHFILPGHGCQSDSSGSAPMDVSTSFFFVYLTLTIFRTTEQMKLICGASSVKNEASSSQDFCDIAYSLLNNKEIMKSKVRSFTFLATVESTLTINFDLFHLFFLLTFWPPASRR